LESERRKITLGTGEVQQLGSHHTPPPVKERKEVTKIRRLLDDQPIVRVEDEKVPLLQGPASGRRKREIKGTHPTKEG